MSTVTLSDALEYHTRGFSIIPTKTDSKEAGCSWSKYQRERPTDANISRWFGGNKRTGVAAIMGIVSGGLVCRDFDQMDSYGLWAWEHPELARTLPTVQTPGPGRHVYCYANPAQIRAVKGSSILNRGDGELRGGGYCLLPPSSNGRGAYKWLVPLGDEIPRIDLVEAGFLPCDTVDSDATQDDSGCLNDDPRMSQAIGTNVSHAADDPATEEAIEFAIVECIPTGFGQRNGMLFKLARALKAITALEDAPLSKLRPIVKRWHKASLAQIRTKPFEESWKTFVDAWPKVKYPKGKGELTMLFEKLSVADLPIAAQDYDQDKVRTLVAFCRELQRHHGDQPFFLGCRAAAKQLEVDHATAARWLSLLVTDEILELVDGGSLGKRQAATYRYRDAL